MIKNKRGQVLGIGIMLMWRLLLIVLIVLFVALTVGEAFSSKQDMRKAEGLILAGKIADCIASQGIVKSDFEIKGCFLQDDEIYASANVYSFESSFSRKAVEGNPAIGVYCEVKQEEGKMYPSCIKQRYYVLIDNGESLEKGALDLTIGIQKYNENVQ